MNIIENLRAEVANLQVLVSLLDINRFSTTAKMTCEQMAATAQKIKDIADKEALILHAELGGFVVSEVVNNTGK